MSNNRNHSRDPQGLSVLLGVDLVPELFHSHDAREMLRRISQRKNVHGINGNLKFEDDNTLDVRTCEIRMGNRVLAQKSLELGQATEELISLFDLALAKI